MNRRRQLALAGLILSVVYAILVDQLGTAAIKATAEPLLFIAGGIVGLMLYDLLKADDDERS